ncbi:signal-regulatory protein beta-2-like [Scomber japonicus]|uniref:signal-regulatory protein beta-2-like n=1 Tax=Scomber japonicus TaxID=13676 RepID=UPI0023056328|nr:signal-regulatory protein beta-2-like [Scomber japonicus]
MMVYTLNVFLLCSLCAAQVIKITQPVSFQSVKPGDSATIQCHIKSDMYKRVWYKLTTGKMLQLVTAFDFHYKHVVFADEFRQRYSVKFNSTSSHLDISATTWEDVGTYYCGVMKLNDIEFGPGTFLMLKGAKMISDSVIQKPESESVQPGRSVTLSCSVHTDHCAAEHTHVLWLKNSDHSAPEMIHSSGNKNNICQKTETGSGEATCVYHLLMRNLSSDDAGTYYCAVTSCGEVLLGKGTKIKMNNTNITKPAVLSPAVIALLLSNISLGIVILILTMVICRSWRKVPAEVNDGASEGNQTNEAVIYASVCSAPRSLSSRQATVKHSGDSVVYSDIWHCQQNQEVSSGEGCQTTE